MKNLTATIWLTIAGLLGNMGESYALPPCPTEQNQTYDNCFGTYTYSNGSKYVGEWKGDKHHGQGIEYYAVGTVNKKEPGEIINL